MYRINDYYPISGIGRLRMGIDGKGIRTLILFHGCSLRCKYCINSFTWDGTQTPKLMSAREMYDNILIDRPYMLATNGGVTFGGGEPLLYSSAMAEFSDCNKDGFSIDMETALNVPQKNLEQVINIVDRYYVDIKSMNPIIYSEYTGGELQLVLDNLKFLIGAVGPERVIVRIPQIPEMTNSDDQNMSKEILNREYGIELFDLFCYRKP